MLMLKQFIFRNRQSSLWRKEFSTNAIKPIEMNSDILVGISETVLMYLMHSKNGEELDTLRTQDLSLGEKWRKMSEVLARTQFHVIHPFGFPPSLEGINAFTHASMRTFSDPNNSQSLTEVQNINKDIWGVLIKRTWGVPKINWLELSIARPLALGISSNLTNPTTLKLVDEISARKNLPLEKKFDALQDEAIIPATKKAMSAMGLGLDDQSYAMTNASIQILGSSDPIIGQALGSAYQVIHEKSKLM